jgi:hypothetical protein
MGTYAKAVTADKRLAQENMVAMFSSSGKKLDMADA